MEKLIELLNEFDSPKLWKETDKWIDNIWKIYEFHSELQIISKKYWFIKRLVDNDKINRDKILKENWLFRKYFYDLEYVKNYDRLVMWLSVEDNPTKFLISYLK